MLAAVATPILFLLFASFLLWLAARWVCAVSRRSAVVLLLLPLCFTGRALLTGKVYAPIDLPHGHKPLASFAEQYGIEEVNQRGLSDISGRIIPWQRAVRHAWRHGEWPLRDPFTLCGQALAGSAEPAPLDPIRLIGCALPLSLSVSFNASAVFFLAGLSMFLFLRDLGCREEASLVGAAGWMFCDFLAFFVQWPMGSTVALTPIVMLAVRRVAHRPGTSSAVLLAVAFCLLILAGHPESTLHVIAVCLVYGVWELIGQERATAARAAAAAVATGIVSLMLCAVYLLPIVETLPQTKEYWLRKGHFANQDRSVDPGEALTRLSPSVVPFAFGRPGEEKPAREHLPERFHPWSSAYVGSVLFAPALFGLWHGRWRGRWVIAGVGVLGLLAGVSAPGVADLLAQLPLFDVTINKRLIFAGGLATAVLAAVGFEAWADGRRRRTLGWLHLAVLLLLGVTISGLWNSMKASGLSESFLWQRTAVELIPLAILAVVHLAAPRTGLVVGLVLACLLAQRTAESGNIYPALPRAAFYPKVAPLHDLPADGAPYRIVALGTILPPNMGTMYGLEDVRGESPLVFEPFSRLFPLWSENHPWFNIVRSLDPPLLSLMNVRFALVPKGIPRPRGWRIAASAPRVRLLENRRVLGRAFIPNFVTLDLPDRSALEEMGSVKSFAHRAWITTNDRANPPRVRRSRNGSGQLSIRRQGLGYELDASMEAPGWVVVSETAWKGWRAASDKGPIPVHTANISFLAIHLDTGDHRVRLEFRPRSFVVGAIVSGSSILLLVMTAAGSMYRSRRRTGRVSHQSSVNSDQSLPPAPASLGSTDH